jgi:hypothetical protein
MGIHQNKNKLLLAFIWIFACGENQQANGNITVSWQVGGMSCQEAEIEKIHVSAFKGETLVREVTAQCELRQALLLDMRAGTYRIQIDGQDLNGRATFRGESESRVVSHVTTAMERPVNIRLRTGELELAWKFSDGSLCRQVDIEELLVYAYDQHAKEVVFSTVECAQGFANFEGIPPGIIDVIIDGQYQGTTTHRGVLRKSFEPGEIVQETITLVPCGAIDKGC